MNKTLQNSSRKNLIRVEEFIVLVHDSIWSLVKSRDGSFGHSLFYISSFAAVTIYVKNLIN
jgi:hypothetical protein